jgi:thymidylate synthase (FAD)
VTDRVEVLDKGYVRYVDHMGSDLSVTNAARASFKKESKRFSDNDAKLLAFLVRKGHESPFRHAFVSLELHAPLMVANQLWKYTVGAAHLADALAWNEASRRYVTIATEFYIPVVWRGAPADRKQGSEGEIDLETSRLLTQRLMDNCEHGRLDYEEALDLGVAPEQARLFLNAYGLYTTWRWSGSLAMWMHVLGQRLPHDAQYETQAYARAIRDILVPLFPVSLAKFVEP